MSAVVDAATDLIGGAADIVTDVVSAVGGAVASVVTFAVDAVIDPVLETVGNTVSAALSDPIKTIAQVAAVSTGQFQLLPLIEGASVAAKGGDLSDVLESTAKAYVMQQVGSYVGEAAGQYAGEAAAGAQYGTSGSQAAMLAAQEAGMATQSAIAATIASGAAGAAVVSVVAGKDPIQAMLAGGVSAGAGALLGKVDGFTTLPKAAQNAIGAAVMTSLSGGNVSQTLVGSLISSSGIVTDIIKQIDPDKKMTDPQRAIVSDILMGTASAAITGGNPSNVVRAAMLKAGSKALGDAITTQFKSATDSVTSASQAASAKATAIENNEASQRTAIDNYNNMRSQLQIRIDEQNRLVRLADEARAALAADNTNSAKNDAAIAARDAAQNYIAALNNDYANFFRPNLDSYSATISKLQTEHTTLTNQYQASVLDFSKATDNLKAQLDPIYFASNRAFVEAMSPGFNADEYRKINGLDANADVYEHYLGKGQFENAPTNLKAAEAEIGAQRTRLVNEALASKGLNLDTADPTQVKKIIDGLDAKYGNNVAALRSATAQDVLTANSAAINQLAKDKADGVFRAESVGQSYGEWQKPPSYTPPAGMKLATLAEMESGKASLQLTSSGQPVWLVQDSSTAQQYWNPASGDYTTVPAEVVVTAKRPSTTEVYQAYAQQETDATFADLFKTVAAVTAGGAGQQLQNWSSALALQFGGNMNNIGYQIGTMLSKWGAENSPATIKTQMEATKNGLAAAAKEGNWWDQSAAALKVIKQNPAAFFAYVGQEGVQEIAPTVAGFATGVITTALSANPVAGIGAATLVSTAIEGIETFGATGKEVYDRLIKQGYSDADARARATLAGYAAAATTAPANAVANAAVFVPYLKGLGYGANAILQGTKGVAAGAAGEYVETYTQTVITQYATNQKIDLAQANVQATFASMVSTGVTGAVMSPAILDGSIAIGKDIAGNALTWDGLTTGKQLADVSSINGDAVIGKDASGKTITLSSAVYSGETSSAGKELTQTISEPPKVSEWLDPYVFDAAEAKAAAASEGYTLSDADAMALVGAKNEIAATAAAKAQFDPLAVTTEEATKYLTDAYKAAGFDVKPTESQVKQFVGQVQEAQQQQDITSYVGANTVTFDEAKKYLTDLGYKPSDAEVKQFVAATNEQAQQTAIGAYVDPRYVDEGEVKAAYEALGLKKPTTADVQKLIGQYAETDLGAKAQANLDSARYNSIMYQLDQMAGQAGVSPEALNAIKADFNQQFQALGMDVSALAGNVSGLQNQVGSIQSALTQAIESAKAVGLEGDAALQSAINSVASNLGTTKTDLLAKLGTTEANLRTDFASQIGAVSTDLQAKFDSLTSEQKALADQLSQQGVDLKSAIDFASQQAKQQTMDLGASLNQRIDQLVQQGTDRYTATQQAIAEVNRQNTELQGLVGTQGRQANQQDIDALTQMLGGQRAVDLAYDVTGDKQITQDDINFLQNVVTNGNTQWTAPTGSAWAPTGLYGQLAASEAQRQADLAAAEKQRQADQAAQIAREKEAARQSAIRATAGQAQTQTQAIMSQLPQVYQSLQQTTNPLYAGEMKEFDLGNPLDVGFFDVRKEAQGGQKQQQATKIATGGYLDDLLDLLR